MIGGGVPPASLRYAVALVAVALAGALLVIGLLGIAFLVQGLVSWAHSADVAYAWARTLAGVGLIGASAGFAALESLAIEAMAHPPRTGQSAMHRARKFVAVIGILLALICLPFAAGIHAAAHGPWLG
jgi:hypothetical protein